jgi:hypothetical protein
MVVIAIVQLQQELESSSTLAIIEQPQGTRQGHLQLPQEGLEAKLLLVVQAVQPAAAVVVLPMRECREIRPGIYPAPQWGRQ